MNEKKDNIDKSKLQTALEAKTNKDVHKEALKQTENEESKPKLQFGEGAVCGPDGCII